MAGLNQEIWTDVLVRQFKATEEALFLNEIPDYSRFVQGTRNENEVIHLVDVGARPEVLINNTTYPVGFASRDDKDIAITLDSYKTKATKVTDDEIQYIAYDKVGTVTGDHSDAIMDVKHNKGLHALTPNSEKTTTPIFTTTGDNNGWDKKSLTMKDLIKLKKSFDDQKIPAKGRVLVLSSDHYNDLLLDGLEKGVFKGQFANESSGSLNMHLYGFKVYWYVDCPYINLSTLTKKSFGSVNVDGDTQASVAFYAPDMFRAKGSTKNYTDPPNTQTQSWMYNVRHNYIVLPKKERGVAAIVSATL